MAVCGGYPMQEQLGRLGAGPCAILVGTPGRLLDLHARGAIVQCPSRLRVVALDETDHMLSIGFAEDVRQLLAHSPETTQRVLISCTRSADVAAAVAEFFRTPTIATDR